MRKHRGAAQPKRSRLPCKAPAVRGWTVCRFHGARGGGPNGARNGMYRHGLYTKDAVEDIVFFGRFCESPAVPRTFLCSGVMMDGRSAPHQPRHDLALPRR